MKEDYDNIGREIFWYEDEDTPVAICTSTAQAVLLVSLLNVGMAMSGGTKWQD